MFMVESLYEMIDGREVEYQNRTKEILNKYSDKLTRAFAFVVNADRNVQWEQFERYSDISNLVYVIGKMSCEKDDIINTPDGAKRVTVDNYTSNVRMVVTIDSLESKEPLELYQEIKTLQTYERLLTPTESYRLFNDPDFYGTLDSSKFRPYRDKIKSIEDFNQVETDIDINEKQLSQDIVSEDFNYDSLTPDQRKKALLFKIVPKIGEIN